MSESVLSTAELMGISSTSVARIPAILDLAYNLEPKMTPCFVGDTGIGKSPIVKSWADERTAACHIVNFGHMLPQDISMALFNEAGTSYGNVPPEWLVKINRDAQDKVNYPGGVVLFLDEINRAPVELLNALFTLTDERRVHDFLLHDDVIVVAAMNPSSDKHNVNRFEKDPAMRKRLAFIHVAEDLNAWLAHAEGKGVPEIVPAFLRAQGESAFYNRTMRAAGKVFTNPGSWDKACRIIAADAPMRADRTGISSAARVLLAGTIGYDMMSSLVTFIESRAFSPEKVFEAASRLHIEEMLALLRSNPSDARLTAFRVTTARWLRDVAEMYVASGVSSSGLSAADVCSRMNEYMTTLPAEQAQSFMSDVGAALNQISVGERDAAWKTVGEFMTRCQLDDILSEQSRFIDP